ncbi:MAG: PTS sugar transporter subunit IIA [Clostridiales bacterium]
MSIRHEVLANENYSPAAIRETIGKELEFKIRKSVRNIKEAGIDLGRSTLMKIVGPELFKVVEVMMDIARSEAEDIHDDVLYYLALHFKQSYERIKLGKPILNPRINQIKKELEHKYYVARKMLDHAEKALGVSFPEEEAGYIAIYLNVNNVNNRDDAKVQIVLLSHGNVAFEMAKLINSIIGQEFVKAVCINVDESSSIALEETMTLSKGLDQGRGILFLADMGATARFGEAVERELGIATRTISHVTTAMALDAAFQVIHHDMTLNELYRKIYSSRENIPKPAEAPKPRIIITLCLTGKGAAGEIKRIIRESIPEISSNEIKIVPLALMQNDFDTMIHMLQRENEVIGIVGTVDPQNKDIPFISMRNIFDEQGISALKAIIKRSNIYYENNEENENEPQQSRIGDLLFPELIFLDYEAKSKKSLLQFISNTLIKRGYVAQGFYQGLLEREEMGGTFFKNHVAFPHTWPEYTKKQVIVVCRLKKAIFWSTDDTVDIIFLLAFEIADKSVIRKLYNTVSSAEKNALLREAKTKEEMIQVLTEP